MKGQLGKLSDALAANLWLVPLLAFGLAFGLSRGLVTIDRTLDFAKKAWFVYRGSPSGARELLATIAGSMITFIGLVFSSTIVVLQLASSQFSPRVMRTFFRDRIIQAALGTFIATFAYAIFVLREIREDPAHPFVPGLSTYMAISLVWLSLAMFVIYINHIGHRIRAITVIEIAARDTAVSLARLHEHRPPRAAFVTPADAPHVVAAPKHGLVASIDGATLLRIASNLDAVLEVVPLPGDSLCTGAPIVRVWCRREISSAQNDRIAGTVSIERERTMREDVLFGIRQLVDVADKALSPGINDPTTAVQVLDELHELLRRIAAGGPRSDVYRDRAGVARVFVPRATWQQYLDHALEEILLYGRHSLHVSRRLRTLVIDLEQTVAAEYRPALAAYRQRVDVCIDEEFEAQADREAARRLPPATRDRQNGTASAVVSLTEAS
jgi:uncharacterized membrane protein